MKHIRVGCAGIVFKNDKLLMGMRGKEPNYGKWILPGGGVGFGESLKDALIREIKEECNIEISDFKYFKYYELINPPNEHRLIFYYTVNFKSGKLIPSSDLLDAKFLTKNEVQALYENRKISNFVEQVLLDLKWLKKIN